MPADYDIESQPSQSPIKINLVPPPPPHSQEPLFTSSEESSSGNNNNRKRRLVFQKSKKNKYAINTAGRNLFWPVRHVRPKYPFNIRWEKKAAHLKNKAALTTYYFVCEEQVKRSEKPGNGYQPYEIRPSFIRFRGSVKRNISLDDTDFFLLDDSPPKKKPIKKYEVTEHGIMPVEAAPAALGTPPNAQPIHISSGDEDLIPIAKIFQSTGKSPTPAEAPQAQIVDTDNFFTCSFQSDSVKFQFTLNKK
jgi:hypothetical protein